MNRFVATVSAVMLTVGLALGVASGDSEAATKLVTIGTGGPTGVYFAAGNAICRMVHKTSAEVRKGARNLGLRCSAPSTGGSNYNIARIKEGEFDFAVVQSDWQYHAFHGDAGPWTDRPVADLRAVFAIYPEPLHIVVSKESGIRGWDDLRGKRVNIGNPGSGQRGTMEQLMREADWTTRDFKLAAEMTSTEQSKALCDGKIDAFVFTVGVPNAGVAVATDGCGARIVNFDNALARKIVGSNSFYAWTTIPKGTYKTSGDDVVTWGAMATFVSSAAVPNDIVYEVVRAVFDNIGEFQNLHPAFAGLEPARMVSDGLSAPIHPGALKYFKEKGLK